MASGLTRFDVEDPARKPLLQGRILTRRTLLPLYILATMAALPPNGQRLLLGSSVPARIPSCGGAASARSETETKGGHRPRATAGSYSATIHAVRCVKDLHRRQDRPRAHVPSGGFGGMPGGRRTSATRDPGWTPLFIEGGAVCDRPTTVSSAVRRSGC